MDENKETLRNVISIFISAAEEMGGQIMLMTNHDGKILLTPLKEAYEALLEESDNNPSLVEIEPHHRTAFERKQHLSNALLRIRRIEQDTTKTPEEMVKECVAIAREAL
jgi:hypothetical protein